MGCSTTSHLLYADDIIVFINRECHSMKHLLKIIDLYERWFGQIVNMAKSAILFWSKINGAQRRGLLQLTSFVEGQFSFNYLGAPITCEG